MNNKERLQLAQWAENRAKKYGATESAISISRSRSVSVEVREQKIENIKESTENSLFLQVYRNNKYSGHSTNNLNKDDLDRFIREAVEATAYLEADPHRTLPDPELYPEDLSKDLGLYDGEQENISPELRVERAMATEALLRQGHKDIITASASFNDSESHSILLNSNGFTGESSGTFFSTGGSVTIMDAGSRPGGSFNAVNRFLKKLPAPEIISEKAIYNSVRQFGQSSIASGRYTMIVENRIAGNLLWRLFQPLSGRSIQQKNSFLLDMIDKPIGSDKLTIIDDPFINGGLGSRLFDNEGIASRKRTIVDNGVLKTYLIDNYYGRKLGMKPNGGSGSNILMGYGSKNQQQLIGETSNGILVTSFNGGNSNNTTGDFSFGISGQLIKNGKIVRAVNEMNISGNFKDLWNKLIETGNDPYQYSSLQSPTLVFKDVDFSGL